VLLGSASVASASGSDQLTPYDLDGDGWADTWLGDTNGDGWFDGALLDRNEDSYTDGLVYDLSGNGVFDFYTLDNNQNGYSEIFARDTNDDGQQNCRDHAAAKWRQPFGEQQQIVEDKRNAQNSRSSEKGQPCDAFPCLGGGVRHRFCH